MTQTIEHLLTQLNTAAETVEFDDVMQTISNFYHYKPTEFSNGELVNQAGRNEGSCKVFAFAQLHQLSEKATLHCFGQYYREDVLQNPKGDDHANIRNFMKSGWASINFSAKALNLK